MRRETLRRAVKVTGDEVTLAGRAALQRACDWAGGQTALAKLIGREQGHVWNWLNVARRVPAEAAIEIERATNGKVPRHEVRPDLWSAPQAEVA